MMRKDDLLEQLIAEIEKGQSLDSISSNPSSVVTPEEDERQLLELVCAIRNLDQPQMRSETADLQKRAVMNELRRSTHSRSEQNSVPSKSAPASGRGWRWVWAGAFAALALFAILVGGAGIWLAGPRDAHRATVVDVTGMVEVASSRAGTEWVLLEDGDVVKEGAHVRTSADSGAALVFFEGSRTVLGEDVDLVLSTLDGGWDKSLKVSFNQLAGETQHSVIPLRGQKSFFGVVTPFGQVNVHGTLFGVNVDKDKQAMVSVDTGKVQVVQDNAQVYLTSGQATTVRKGQSLEKPAYQFSVQGRLTSMEELWTVAGVQFTVDPDTLVLQNFQLGDPVLARGRILEDGTYLADRIDIPKNKHEKAKLTGEVTAVGSDYWVIGNTTIWLDEETEFEGAPVIGNVVSVNFVVLGDQRWVAKEIELLDEDGKGKAVGDTETPEGTDTATPEETSTLTPSVEETETLPSSETPDPTEEAFEQYCTGNTDHHPDGVKLSEKHHVPYEEIMGWFCQKNGFGEIDLVYSLSLQTGVSVEEIFAMRQAGMGWGEIKALLLPKPTKEPMDKPTKTPKPPEPTELPEPTQLHSPAVPAVPGGPGETAVPAVPASPVKPTKKPK